MCDTLDMYGSPDPNSAYSLSGVVSIAVSSPYSIFEGRKTARLLLQSLSITFEGQSEIYTPNTGYSSVRLCSITRELAPEEPVELSNEGHEDDELPCKWDVVFNLATPGWLPASTYMGIEDIGIRYGLYATAKFINLETEQPTTFSLASLCTPFRSRIRSAESSRPITVRRFVLPPHIEQPEPTFINYLVKSRTASRDDAKAGIPAEILSKIQVLASVPETVSTEETIMPVTIRLRTKDLESVECKRLQVTEIGIDMIQQERCRHRPSSSYLARYPLPPREMQPPNLPLRDPHPMSNIYDVGLYVTKEHSESVCRSFTLLPAGESGKYKLADNNYAFANDADQGSNPTWFTMETRVPFCHVSRAKNDIEVEEWAGPAVIRPSSSSPLFSISHEISLSLTFTYDMPGSTEKAKERLNFAVPVCFGQYLPSSASIPGSPQVEGRNGRSASSLTLPPYSQLYDSNGERKIDYSIPLPRYTPKEEHAANTGDLALETSTSSGDKAESQLPIGEDVPLLAL
ncbi:hypothetical protein CC2G_005437 [Coprinopsis cinerea AmutBmut pab1-1]|nr:hypothetical protein CC2G_005437 [Coprinopsis cinerea AmutBmut pab1-1]